uniref:Uncharacterized protein n=1 Tax=Eptatretus burgeri TaxID=7764 RepID=A0A8C4QFC0_EPTBU
MRPHSAPASLDHCSSASAYPSSWLARRLMICSCPTLHVSDILSHGFPSTCSSCFQPSSTSVTAHPCSCSSYNYHISNLNNPLQLRPYSFPFHFPVLTNPLPDMLTLESYSQSPPTPEIHVTEKPVGHCTYLAKVINEDEGVKEEVVQEMKVMEDKKDDGSEMLAHLPIFINEQLRFRQAHQAEMEMHLKSYVEALQVQMKERQVELDAICEGMKEEQRRQQEEWNKVENSATARQQLAALCIQSMWRNWQQCRMEQEAWPAITQIEEQLATKRCESQINRGDLGPHVSEGIEFGNKTEKHSGYWKEARLVEQKNIAEDGENKTIRASIEQLQDATEKEEIETQDEFGECCGINVELHWVQQCRNDSSSQWHKEGESLSINEGTALQMEHFARIEREGCEQTSMKVQKECGEQLNEERNSRETESTEVDNNFKGQNLKEDSDFEKEQKESSSLAFHMGNLIMKNEYKELVVHSGKQEQDNFVKDESAEGKAIHSNRIHEEPTNEETNILDGMQTKEDNLKKLRSINKEAPENGEHRRIAEMKRNIEDGKLMDRGEANNEQGGMKVLKNHTEPKKTKELLQQEQRKTGNGKRMKNHERRKAKVEEEQEKVNDECFPKEDKIEKTGDETKENMSLVDEDKRVFEEKKNKPHGKINEQKNEVETTNIAKGQFVKDRENNTKKEEFESFDEQRIVEKEVNEEKERTFLEWKRSLEEEKKRIEEENLRFLESLRRIEEEQMKFEEERLQDRKQREKQDDMEERQKEERDDAEIDVKELPKVNNIEACKKTTKEEYPTRLKRIDEVTKKSEDRMGNGDLAVPEKSVNENNEVEVRKIQLNHPNMKSQKIVEKPISMELLKSQTVRPLQRRKEEENTKQNQQWTLEERKSIKNDISVSGGEQVYKTTQAEQNKEQRSQECEGVKRLLGFDRSRHHDAATIIQASWRGFRLRAVFRQIIESVRLSDSDSEELEPVDVEEFARQEAILDEYWLPKITEPPQHPQIAWDIQGVKICNRQGALQPFIALNLYNVFVNGAFD